MNLMRFSIVYFFICLEYMHFSLATESVNATKRYEYMFSFKPPLLAQSNGEIPFFEHGGQSIASADSLRLTPSMVNKQGWVWSKNAAKFPGFEASFSFRVTGRGRIGADGLAFWYVAEKSQGGPMFGAANKWNGLAIVFDTYDNDGEHNNPLVMAFINDGTSTYNHDLDGQGDQKGQCLRDFRNRPYPIRVVVQYYEQKLNVLVGHGMSEKDEDISLCFSVDSVKLPEEGYFGLSAATGDLADDHDIYRLELHSLHDPKAKNVTSENKLPEGSAPSESDREKLEKEFTEYVEQLKVAQEEYEKQQNEKKKQKKHTEEEIQENESNRNLRQIWESQSSLLVKVHDVEAKVQQLNDHIKSYPEDSIKLHEVLNLLSALSTQINSVKKSMEDEIREQFGHKPDAFSQKAAHNELRDSLNDIKNALTSSNQMLESKFRNDNSQKTESCPTCLGPELFLLFSFGQTVLLIAGYYFYKKREVSVKKFY